MLYENTASYTPDFAAEIDTEEEILADEISERGNRITLKQARYVQSLINAASDRQQSRVVATIIDMVGSSRKPNMACDCLAVAAGLDQMDGIKSQSELAERHGVTRALISYNVIRFRDSLSGNVVKLDNFKFRKSNASREVYKEKAKKPLTAALDAARREIRNQQ